MNTTTTPTIGPWVSSWWGQYGPSRALIVAADIGATVAASHLELAQHHLNAMGPGSTEPPTAEGLDIIAEALAEAEAQLPAYDRTGWGWYDGEWGHFLLDPEIEPWPTVEWTATIYDHGPEDDDPDRESEGPIEHAIGYISPSNCWDPTTDPELIPYHRHSIELDELPDHRYSPTAAAAAALRTVETVTGSIDHIELDGRGGAVCYGADEHHDWHGAVGYPLARFFATRQGIIRNLTGDEQQALIEIHRGSLTSSTPTR